MQYNSELHLSPMAKGRMYAHYQKAIFT